MHLTFLITEKNFQKQVIFKNLIVYVTTNQYQYKMKNESSQRLIHFNKLLFCRNIQSQMTQTPIKYFKGELLHVLQKGSDSSYIHRVTDIYI